MNKPTFIVLVSGKRKSGKDYICERVKTIVGEEFCTILRISGPLKSLYATNHNLDFNKLLSDGPYKETYRRAMIEWSDKIREAEPGYFCKAACDAADRKIIWIVSDIRRKSDVQWFQEAFPDKIITIRVEADVKMREKRGWVFTPGVDDVASECNLDDYTEWNLIIANNNESELEVGLTKLMEMLNFSTNAD